MPKKSDSIELKRLEIPYFEGVNGLVGHNISKKQELKHVENARSKTIGFIEKREGTRRLGDDISATANYGLFFFTNTTGTGMFRVSTVSATTSVYYLNNSSVWTALTGGGTSLTAADVVGIEAEGNYFIVNGNDANRYIAADGTTVTTAATASGHLYGSPVSYLINYYKDRLYLGDYTVTTRYKTSVLRSSKPLGIVALVDGDHTAPITSLKVTDTKYIRSSDSLDIYRAGTKIGTVTVTAKAEDTLTISSFGTDINSADEVWVANTYTGTRQFRWPDNPASGEDVKLFDTFKLTGGDTSALTMMTNVGNVMMISNKTSLAAWNDYNLEGFDIGVGCVSKRGWVKKLGVLWFLGYDGIYASTGASPKLMSAKVEPYIKGATKSGLESGAAGAKGLSVFFAIGNSTLYNDDGSTWKTLTNVVLEYDMRKEDWFIHHGVGATQFATYVSSSDPDRLQYTVSADEVYEFLHGTSDADGTANGTEIPFEVQTDKITISDKFEEISYPKAVALEVIQGSGIQVFVGMDDSRPYPVEQSAVKGVNILKINSRNEEEGEPRCRKITIVIKEFSKRAVKIGRLAILYAETPEQETHRP